MTDLNTQMTPEAMMQAEIERLKRIISATNRTWTDEMYRLDDELADVKAVSSSWMARAEKAERELAELRTRYDASREQVFNFAKALDAKTDALIAAAYADAALLARPKKRRAALRGGGRNTPVYKDKGETTGIQVRRQISENILSHTPADAKAALEARDRAMRNEGRRQAASLVRTHANGWNGTKGASFGALKTAEASILSLIEQEPEGKGDE